MTVSTVADAAHLKPKETATFNLMELIEGDECLVSEWATLQARIL